jgi:hypothetical protein
VGLWVCGFVCARVRGCMDDAPMWMEQYQRTHTRWVHRLQDTHQSNSTQSEHKNNAAVFFLNKRVTVVTCKTIQSLHQPKGPTASSIVSHAHAHILHTHTNTRTRTHTRIPVSCRVEASQKRDSHHTNQGPTPSASVPRAHTHTHTYTHERTRTHARTRTHTHAPAHTFTPHAHARTPVSCRVEASQPRSRSDSGNTTFARPVGYMSVAVHSCERVRKAVNTPKDGSLLNHSNEW